MTAIWFRDMIDLILNGLIFRSEECIFVKLLKVFWWAWEWDMKIWSNETFFLRNIVTVDASLWY
jgi:hypothetical protein